MGAVTGLVVNQKIGFLKLMMATFGMLMLILAILFIFFHYLFSKNKVFSEITFRWIAFFALGLTCLCNAMIHLFYPQYIANALWIETSPFQYDVGIANLAIGILGILSFNADFGFRKATTIGATLFLWGTAFGHLYQIILLHDFFRRAQPWFWLDILVPIILICCLRKMRIRKTFF
jgi:hypothetical protein